MSLVRLCRNRTIKNVNNNIKGVRLRTQIPPHLPCTQQAHKTRQGGGPKQEIVRPDCKCWKTVRINSHEKRQFKQPDQRRKYPCEWGWLPLPPEPSYPLTLLGPLCWTPPPPSPHHAPQTEGRKRSEHVNAMSEAACLAPLLKFRAPPPLRQPGLHGRSLPLAPAPLAEAQSQWPAPPARTGTQHTWCAGAATA